VLALNRDDLLIAAFVLCIRLIYHHALRFNGQIIIIEKQNISATFLDQSIIYSSSKQSKTVWQNKGA